MGVIYALCAITGLLSVLVVYLENKGILALKYVLKSVASLCFVIVAMLCLMQSGMLIDSELGAKESWKALVVTALIFGMLGDIFLSSENVVADKKALGLLTITGGVFFLVGHIVYVVWLIGFTETFNLWTLFAVGGLPLLVFVLAKLKIFKAGKLLIPVMVYAAFLGLMLASSINAYLDLADFDIGKYIVAAGTLFCVSDLVLAYYNFGHKQQTFVKYIYMPSYYVAQLLFALTILF